MTTLRPANLRALGLQTLSSLGLRAFQIGALLLLTLGLARLLGPVQFGVYSYAASWLALLAGLTTAGFAHASVREVAQALALEQPVEARSHIRTAYLATLATSFGVVALVLLARGSLFARGPDMARAASLGVALSPLLALIMVAQAVLLGQGRSTRAQIAELLVLPGLMLLATAWLVVAGPSWRTAERALDLYGGCLLLALLTGASLQWRAFPLGLCQGEKLVDSKWLVAALPFLLVLVSATVNQHFDVLTIGQVLGPRETGVYAFAARLSQFPAIILVVIALPLSPAVAALFAKREQASLQRLVGTAALVGALGSTVVAGCVAAFAPWLSRLVDPTFEAGQTALVLLCLGRVAEAWLGPGGTVLTMTRHAWQACLAVTVGAVASVALNLLLVPHYGIEGAAVATAASCLLRGGAMWYWARSCEGIKASAFEALADHWRQKAST